MNGEVIKEFLVGLGFEIDDGSLSRFNAGITSATLAVTAIGTAAVAASVAVAKFVSGIAEKFDALSDLSARVNETAEEIMRLGYVASLNDSSVEAVASSFDRLGKVAGEAIMGLGRGKVVFEQLGISVKDSNGKLKGTSLLMSEIGEKIKGMEKGQQLAVLEKLGIDPTMLATLTTDVSALKAEFDSIYASAGVNINDAAQASSDFMDSLGRLRFVMEAISNAVGLKFMSQIKNGIDSMRKFLVENMPKIINAVSPIIDIVLRIADAFIAIVSRVAQAISAIIGWLARANEATDGWAGYILAAAAAWKYLNLAFLATPIGMIISLAAAIVALVDDFLTWKEGGESLIDWSVWEPTIDAAIGAITNLRDVLTNAFTYMFASVDALVKLLTGDFQGAWFAVGEMVNSVIGIFNSAWEAIKSLGGAIGSFVDAASGIFGGKDNAASAVVPSPQTQAALAGANQTVSQQTQIIVEGSPNPDATARSVANQQNRVNADMARNMRGAAR